MKKHSWTAAAFLILALPWAARSDEGDAAPKLSAPVAQASSKAQADLSDASQGASKAKAVIEGASPKAAPSVPADGSGALQKPSQKSPDVSTPDMSNPGEAEKVGAVVRTGGRRPGKPAASEAKPSGGGYGARVGSFWRDNVKPGAQLLTQVGKYAGFGLALAGLGLIFVTPIAPTLMVGGLLLSGVCILLGGLFNSIL